MKWHISNIKDDTLDVRLFWQHKDKMRLILLEDIVYYRKGESTDGECIDDMASSHYGNFQARKEIIVPSGYTSDGASIPKVFWWILSPFEDYFKCCVLHDYLCDLFHLNLLERKTCDDIFLEAMSEIGIKKSTRLSLYFFVRFYGLLRYNPLMNLYLGKGKVEEYNQEFFEKESSYKVNLYSALHKVENQQRKTK